MSDHAVQVGGQLVAPVPLYVQQDHTDGVHLANVQAIL